MRGIQSISVFMIAATMSFAGCAGTASQTPKQSATITAISAALITANIAESGFLAYNSEHELDIARTATSKEDAEAKLDAYHLKRAPVDRAFVAYFKAVAVVLQLKDDHSVSAIINERFPKGS